MFRGVKKKLLSSWLGVVITFQGSLSAHALWPMGENDTHEETAEYGKSFNSVKRFISKDQIAIFSAVKVGETRTEDVYLTAAHSLRTSFTWLGVRHYEVHPLYKPSLLKAVEMNTSRNDIALIFTDKSDDKMVPIYQGDWAKLANANATTVGYGKRYINRWLSEKNNILGTLEKGREAPRQASETEISYEPTYSLFTHLYLPRPSGEKPYAAITGGDSGGPLLWQNPQAGYEVIGITSGNGPVGDASVSSFYNVHNISVSDGRNYAIADSCPVNSYYKDIHEKCANLGYLDVKLLESGICCYGTMDLWQIPDRQFIGDIFQKYKVTTPSKNSKLKRPKMPQKKSKSKGYKEEL